MSSLSKKQVIKRSEWERGLASALTIQRPPTPLGSDDKPMYTHCCLGIRARDFGGMKPARGLGKGTPDSLVEDDSFEVKKEFIEEWCFKDDKGWYDKAITDEAVAINDSTIISDTEREEKLIKLFAENGIELTFED